MKVFPVDLPQDYIKKAGDLSIIPTDIIEQFIKGNGKGGQKINKTSLCVFLKHKPSGLEVRCQKHREQSKNRISAYKLLINKIEESVRGLQSQRAQKIFKLRKQKMKRSQRARNKILENKKKRSEIKQSRQNISSL